MTYEVVAVEDYGRQLFRIMETGSNGTMYARMGLFATREEAEREVERLREEERGIMRDILREKAE